MGFNRFWVWTEKGFTWLLWLSLEDVRIGRNCQEIAFTFFSTKPKKTFLPRIDDDRKRFFALSIFKMEKSRANGLQKWFWNSQLKLIKTSLIVIILGHVKCEPSAEREIREKQKKEFNWIFCQVVFLSQKIKAKKWKN